MDHNQAPLPPFTDRHQAPRSPFTDQHRTDHQASQSPFTDQKNQHLSAQPYSHSSSPEHDHHSSRTQCVPHSSSSHHLTHGDPHSSSLHQLTRSPSAPYSISIHDPHSLSPQCAPYSTTVKQEVLIYNPNEPSSVKADPPASLQFSLQSSSLDPDEVAKTPVQSAIASQSTSEEDVSKKDLSHDDIKDSKNAEEQPNLNFINALNQKYKIYTKDGEALFFLNSSGINGLEEGICIR